MAETVHANANCLRRRSSQARMVPTTVVVQPAEAEMQRSSSCWPSMLVIWFLSRWSLVEGAAEVLLNGLVVLALGGVIPECMLSCPCMTGIDEFQLCLWIFVERSTWTSAVGTVNAGANSLLCLRFSSQHGTNSYHGNNT